VVILFGQPLSGEIAMSTHIRIRVLGLATLAVVAWLAVGALQPAQAQGTVKLYHLQISMYEIREAKLDVRNIKGGIPDKFRNEILATLDAAANALKRCIEACGEKVHYDMPLPGRPDYPNFQHLRHAIKELKEAREQLKIEKGVPDDLRADALKLIDLAIVQCEKALNYVKQPAQAQGTGKLFHLQIALYEIREAKLECRAIGSATPDKYRLEVLGTLDAAADALKRCIEACGEKAKYDPPNTRPDYPNFQHLRHAIKELKEAREQLKTEKGVLDDLRAEALKLIDRAIVQSEKFFDSIK
jgi:hypothetical protein